MPQRNQPKRKFSVSVQLLEPAGLNWATRLSGSRLLHKAPPVRPAHNTIALRDITGTLALTG